MNEWSIEQLREMCGDDVIEQLSFVAGCHKNRVCNDDKIPDGWIISDEVLRKFAELIVKECLMLAEKRHEYAMDNSWNVDETMSVFRAEVEDHFGVEE